MIAGEVLLHLHGAILHVGNCNFGGSRLRRDESTEALQLPTETDTGTVVEKNKQFERGVISLRGHPVGDLVAIVPLEHHHVATANVRHVCAMASLDGDE